MHLSGWNVEQCAPQAPRNYFNLKGEKKFLTDFQVKCDGVEFGSTRAAQNTRHGMQTALKRKVGRRLPNIFSVPRILKRRGTGSDAAKHRMQSHLAWSAVAHMCINWSTIATPRFLRALYSLRPCMDPTDAPRSSFNARATRVRFSCICDRSPASVSRPHVFATRPHAVRFANIVTVPQENGRLLDKRTEILMRCKTEEVETQLCI